MSNINGSAKLYTPELVEEIRAKLVAYIATNNLPQVAEFAYLNKIPRQTIYELEGIRDLVEQMHAKKECNLVQGGLDGSMNASIVKFVLSQRGIGYSDKQETTGNLNLKIEYDIPDSLKPEVKEETKTE
jgi:hypothetical protein